MSKYNPNGLNVRSADEIQEALVNHPDNEWRRDEIELLCLWRRAQERHISGKGFAALSEFERKMDGEKSQAMRALTLLAERSGDNQTIYHAHTDNFLTLKWMLNTMPQEQRIDLAAAYKKSQENQIRLPEPGPELSPVVYEGMTGLCRIYIKADALKFCPQDPIVKLLSGEMFDAPCPRPSMGPKLN